MEAIVASPQKKSKRLFGGAGYRSPYLSHAKRALYHLSYTPIDELLAVQIRHVLNARPSCRIAVASCSDGWADWGLAKSLCTPGGHETAPLRASPSASRAL